MKNMKKIKENLHALHVSSCVLLAEWFWSVIPPRQMLRGAA
jgi:hypothetical protein